MGLGILILGLLIFLGTHVFVSFRKPRARVIAQLGLPAYRGLFALVSLAGRVPNDAATHPGGVGTLIPIPLSSQTSSSGTGIPW